MTDKSLEFFNSLTGPERMVQLTMSIMTEYVGVERLEALVKWGKDHPEGTLAEFAQDKPGFIKAYNKAQQEIQTLSESEKKSVQDYYKNPNWSRIAAIGDYTINEFIKRRNDQYVKDGHTLAGIAGFFPPAAMAIEVITSVADATRPVHPGEPGRLEKLANGAFNAASDAVPFGHSVVQVVKGEGGFLLDGSVCHLVRDVTDHPGQCTNYLDTVKQKIAEKLHSVVSGGSHVEGTGGMPDKTAHASAHSHAPAPNVPNH